MSHYRVIIATYTSLRLEYCTHKIHTYHSHALNIKTSLDLFGNDRHDRMHIIRDRHAHQTFRAMIDVHIIRDRHAHQTFRAMIDVHIIRRA